MEAVVSRRDGELYSSPTSLSLKLCIFLRKKVSKHVLCTKSFAFLVACTDSLPTTHTAISRPQQFACICMIFSMCISFVLTVGWCRKKASLWISVTYPNQSFLAIRCKKSFSYDFKKKELIYGIIVKWNAKRAELGVELWNKKKTYCIIGICVCSKLESIASKHKIWKIWQTGNRKITDGN